MPRPPDNMVQITDFTGIVANADHRDVPEGAAEDQVNACSIVAGELRVRHGILALTFEEF